MLTKFLKATWGGTHENTTNDFQTNDIDFSMALVSSNRTKFQWRNGLWRFNGEMVSEITLYGALNSLGRVVDTFFPGESGWHLADITHDDVQIHEA
jgi:hypothetical protein